MIIIKKHFSKKLVPIIQGTKKIVLRDFELNPVNNVNLVCEKVYKNRNLEGDIVECGVFSGSTLFTIAKFCELTGINKKIIGFDTFGGFPEGQTNKLDLPIYFKTLLSRGFITKEHFDKAAKRTKDFTDITHLSIQYFLDVDRVWEISKLFGNVSLVKGSFIETLPKYKCSIAVLYLDCDLYQSYKDCLEILYDRVISGGVIIFDEYYSLKYPGARVAVNEFFSDKNGSFEYYITDEGFERWCFVKDKKQ